MAEPVDPEEAFEGIVPSGEAVRTAGSTDRFGGSDDGGSGGEEAGVVPTGTTAFAVVLR